MSKTFEAIKAVRDEISSNGQGTFGRCANFHGQSRSNGCPVLGRIWMELEHGNIRLSNPEREAETDPRTLAEWFAKDLAPYHVACGGTNYEAPNCGKVTEYLNRVAAALHEDTVGTLGLKKVVVKELPHACVFCPFSKTETGWYCRLTGCPSNYDYDRARNCPLVKED